MKYEVVYHNHITRIIEECRKGLYIYLVCSSDKVRSKIMKRFGKALTYSRYVFTYGKGILVVATKETDIDIFNKYYRFNDGRKKISEKGIKKTVVGSRIFIDLSSGDS